MGDRLPQPRLLEAVWTSCVAGKRWLRVPVWYENGLALEYRSFQRSDAAPQWRSMSRCWARKKLRAG